MTHFFYKLIPPRPAFPMDMTEAEGSIMQEHFTYWRNLLAKRKVVVYGPVIDPSGNFGVAVLEVEDESTARKIAEKDPAIRSNAGFSFDLCLMPDTIVRQ